MAEQKSTEETSKSESAKEDSKRSGVDLKFDDNAIEIVKGMPTVMRADGNLDFPYVNSDAIERAKKEFKTLSSDVLLISFPKSGTHLLMQLVFSILEKPVGDFIYTCPWVEMVATMNGFQSMAEAKPTANNSDRRVMRTHASKSGIPFSKIDSDTKVIYIARNPKDTLISNWNFMKALYGYKGSLDDYCQLFMKGMNFYNDWWVYQRQYWQWYTNQSTEYAKSQQSLVDDSKGKSQILWIFYEDLLADLEAHIKKMALFLDAKMDISKLESRMDRIIADSNIDAMRQKCAEDNHEYSKVWSAKAFYRKGGVGGWKEQLSDTQSKAIDEKCRVYFDGLQLKSLFTFE